MPHGMNDKEWNEMVEADRAEFFAYLDKLAHYNWLKENGQLDADMRQPEAPAFVIEF